MSSPEYRLPRMHVGILTYQTGHLKTWEITRSLLTKGYRITLFAFPFKLRPSQLQKNNRFKDRPDQLIDFDMYSFCQQYGIEYIPVPGWNDEYSDFLGKIGMSNSPEIYLHCIAKIVPASFIKGRIILNCHPGLLPCNRGVDAFKWSIVNKWPIGITLHAIDQAIDRGTILRRMRIPVFSTDTLAAVCRRAYEFETDLLANFEHHLRYLTNRWFVGDDFPCSHSTISIEQDQQLEQIFEQNREELCRCSIDFTMQPHPSDGFNYAKSLIGT